MYDNYCAVLRHGAYTSRFPPFDLKPLLSRWIPNLTRRRYLQYGEGPYTEERGSLNFSRIMCPFTSSETRLDLGCSVLPGSSVGNFSVEESCDTP